MPGYEKSEIDRLLTDVARKKFNAVVVTKADRWSRDNKTSQRGIDVFKKNKIRFFAGVTEYDLYNPDHLLILGMSAVIGQFFGNNQNKDSMLNRINRAKRGIPTGGKLPFGRRFDKKTETWSIDETTVKPHGRTKKEIIVDCANRYLAGENIVHLADEYGMNYANLHKILMKRSGTEWELKFNSDEFNIHEVVKLTIPPLLPGNVIKKLHKRCQANKTYTHGKIKTPYLLSRMIFCEDCGYAYSGAVNHGNRRYRHAHGRGAKEIFEHPQGLLEADVVENAVMGHLFECFGNPKALEQALENAMPDIDKIKKYHERLERLEKSLKRLTNHRQIIMTRERRGTITEAESEKQLDETVKERSKIEHEIERVKEYLQNMPNPSTIKSVANTLSRNFSSSAFATKRRAIASRINTDFKKMTYEQKRCVKWSLVVNALMVHGWVFMSNGEMANIHSVFMDT